MTACRRVLSATVTAGLLAVGPIRAASGSTPPLRTATETYQDGTLKRRYTYISSRGRRFRHGYDSRYAADGRLQAKMTFVRGRLHGKAALWYPNGQLKEEGTFRNGRKDGLWRTWYADGTRRSETQFTDGKRDGPATAWFANGKRRREGAYVAGRRDGVHRSWDSTGIKRREVAYREGARHGVARTFYADGRPRLEAHYADDRQHGRCRLWQPDGTILADGIYADGKPQNGTCLEPGDRDGDYYVQTYRDGTVVDTVFYEKGTPKTGDFTEWHVNGVRWHRCEYRDGRKNGTETWWYRSGEIFSRCTWKNNRLDGLYSEWFDGGGKRLEVTCRDGEKDGPETIWDRRGTVLATGINRHDKPWSGTLKVVDAKSGDAFLQVFADGRPVGLADAEAGARPAAAMAGPTPRRPTGADSELNDNDDGEASSSELPDVAAEGDAAPSP